MSGRDCSFSRFGSLALLALALLPGMASADIPEALDRATLSLGEFYPAIDTRIEANGPMVAGSDVDFQRDLGLDNHRSLPTLRFEFLVFDSQGFGISGYRYSKHGAATLSRDISFDGHDYAIDAAVQARLRLDVVDAAWHWWFSPDPRDVIGVGLGAAYYDLKGTISASLAVNGDENDGSASAEADAIAPLLTLGWRHAFSEDLRGYLDFSGVRKPNGPLSGHLLNAVAGLEYYPWRNFGFALEYSANNLDLKADKASWEGRARIHFYGPAAFVRMRF